MKSVGRFLFLMTWLFVGFVEAYDVYWSVKLQDTLYENELNPIGKFLISSDNGDVALFMALKVAAIILILGSLPAIMFANKAKLAWFLLCIVCISRLALLVFLETGHLW